MRTICFFSGVLLAIAFSLSSCRPKIEITADNEIGFDSIRTTRNYHVDNDSTQPSCNLNLTFVYPSSYSNKASLDSLQRIFISSFFDESYSRLTPQDAVGSYEENYVQSYRDDVVTFSRDRIYEHDSSDTYFSYYEIGNNRILFNKGGILSFQVSQTNYKGGASSYDFLKNYVVDLESMTIIMERDIFREGYEKFLGVIFRDYLLKDKKAKSLVDLENLGYFGLDEMAPNENFLLDDKGITYIFNKGEYSGYKTEAIIISIDYSEIKHLMKEASPISKFISM